MSAGEAPPRVLLIGWDAADWRIITPLLEEGKMPNLEGMINRGVMGNLASLQPMYSPMLWTSIATGKRPFNHGVLGFFEPDETGGGVRPVSNHARTCRAIWNILHLQGRTSQVVGWWPSHPVDPVRGAMVSNRFQHAPRQGPEDSWPLAPGTVHPQRLEASLGELRVHPGEFSGDVLLPFLPTLAELDVVRDQRPHAVAKILAETVSIHAAATALMQLEPWDFMGVYYDAIDHFGHGFMKYHPPRRAGISEADFGHYRQVMETAYRFHDQMLGSLLTLAGEDAHVLLVSDHGFHPDHLRPERLPLEPAGPAAEHRPHGILVACGPRFRQDERIHGASLLDITPTLLTLFDLPVGQDMDGRPLTGLFLDPPPIRTLPSWDGVAGEDGRVKPGGGMDAATARAAMQRLVDLGYVDPADADGTPDAVERARREWRYNEAVSRMDARGFAEALPILESLWRERPSDLRFPRQLATCCQALGRMQACRQVVERMLAIRSRLRDQARDALRELKGRRLRRNRGIRKMVKQLHHLAMDTEQDEAYVRGLLAFAEGDAATARDHLDSPSSRLARDPAHHLRVGEVLLNLGDSAAARDRFLRCRDLDPDSAPAWRGLAGCALVENQPSDAVGCALQSLGLQFFQPGTHLLLGQACERTGNPARAEEAYRVALNQAPFWRKPRQALIDLYRGPMKDPDRADREQRQLSFLSRPDPASVPGGVATHPEDPLDLPGVEDGILDISLDPWLALDPPEVPLLIVSGLPRSGTSLMMQMLDAGGVGILTDRVRTPDTDNPQGYYEYEPVKTLARDATWLQEAGGRAVKIVAPLLRHVPREFPCHIIFMLRDLDEILGSQQAMLTRAGSTAPAADDTLRQHLMEELSRLQEDLQARANVRLLLMEHAEVIRDPVGAAKMLATFLERQDLPVERVAAVVRPDLHRQRSDGESGAA